MGLLTSIVTLPLAPVRGVIALGRVVQRQVEQETRDPSAVRRRLEALEEAEDAGELSETEKAEAQRQIVASLIEPKPPGAQGTERWNAR